MQIVRRSGRRLIEIRAIAPCGQCESCRTGHPDRCRQPLGSVRQGSHLRCIRSPGSSSIMVGRGVDVAMAPECAAVFECG